MLTDPKLRSQVEAVWNKFWTGRLGNLYEPPLDMSGADAMEWWFTEKEVDKMNNSPYAANRTGLNCRKVAKAD